jgi:hypothetical protein
LNDEKLGNIEDVIFDHTSGNIHYAVVDTGGWLSSKKFLVPALTLRVSVTDRAVPVGTDSVVISNSAVGIGGRWDTFQSRRRERRKEAVSGCNTCSGESAVKRGSESADTLRKAV